MSILTTTIGQIMVLFSFIFLGFFVAKLFIISFLFNLCMVFLAVAVVKAVFPSIFLGVFSIFLNMFVMLALVNSVNLLDGLDGLCSGVSFVNFIAFSVIIALRKQDFSC